MNRYHHSQVAFCATTLVLALPQPGHADQDLRVATWNIETISAPGTPQYAAATAVLGRIDADIVAVQEVASDSDASYLALLRLVWARGQTPWTPVATAEVPLSLKGETGRWVS